MTKQRRRKVFFFLIAIFFILAPLLILYSLGYSFDIRRGSLEQTGGIFVKSKTGRLSLFLDGAFVKETSFFSGGALLTSVPSGTHLIRLEKAGFQPWFKTVPVEQAVVTELRHIILVSNPPFVATSTKEETALFSAPPTSSRTLRIDKKGNLIERKAEEDTLIASNVHSFGLNDGRLYWVDKNGFLARLEDDNKTIITVGRPGFYLEKDTLEFIGSGIGTLAILDPSGGLFLVEAAPPSVVPFESGVLEASFDSKGEKLLLRKYRSVEMVWLRDYQYQPFTKKGTKQKILEISQTIKDAYWYYEDEMHVILRTAGGIYMTEVDGRGGRNTAELVPGPTDELRTLPEIPNAVFFRKEKAWFKIEI